ncbi:60S ribosomal protein L23a-like protein [Rozella allomycis CSF55]|uniref:60S ribosomal protein L23a n=1 Tax=Rozella allomycis (strain CSF55) TaxID=988480 RepID=A0A075AWP0_ROZAC|nr:60S ribosomal protein L23a [Rozella allomycis CSF55]RKP21148.1 60S ribosomal protein L23a-like protein [Rozella allomycis CSF55]RKP21151.1 60S ribosomal protein L23a-like protein [Rozella allomycis CSF55]|eukprot:EPZ34567.1 60S ribosomal protein L23a [Rozella allomycis CSF55]
MSKQVKQAKEARKAVVKGTNSHEKKKIRTKTHFFRPKTLRLPRTPKYLRRAVTRQAKFDAYTIVKFPLTTETAMQMIENERTLVFVCDVRANKRQIRDAVKKLYDVQAARINTLIRPDGQKKAFVKLTADSNALEVASKIGFI